MTMDATATQDSDEWPRRTVDAPFASPVAKSKLAVKPFSFDQPTIDELDSVVRMFWDVNPYNGCPYADSTECTGRSFVIVSRGYVFSGRKFSDDLNKEARSHSFGGCSYLNVGSDLQSVSSNLVQWGGNWNGSNNACGKWPWGSKWSYSNGKAEGWWKFRLVLREYEEEGEIEPFFCFEPQQENKTTDEKGLFGLYDPDTFLGGFLDTVLFRTDISPGELLGNLIGSDTAYEMMKKFKRRIRNRIASIQKTLLATQAKTESQFKSILNKQDVYEEEYRYLLKETQFEKEGADSFALVITESFILDNTRGLAAIAYANAKHMEDIIRGLSERPKTHTVGVGDSLWKLALENYGYGELYHLLLFANQNINRYGRLWPGETIVIPPLVDFTQPVDDGRIVLPGNTIWNMYTERFGTTHWDPREFELPPLSSDIDSIYAFQVVKWPDGLDSKPAKFTADTGAPVQNIQELCKSKLGGE
ncbi:MAG: LysM peptidoglycan-binding domain-containing protein [Candidatus Thiodiazotropha sp.]